MVASNTRKWADAIGKEAALRVEVEPALANGVKKLDQRTWQVQQRLIAVAFESMQADELDPPSSRRSIWFGRAPSTKPDP